MGIGDSITLVSCLAGLMLALPAFLIFNSLMFSQTTYYAAQRLQRGAITPFFVGLGLAVAVGLPTALMVSLGSIFQFFGVIAALAAFLWAFTGLAAIARLVGMRLGALADRDENVFFETTVGAVVLSFALAFPLIGWLLLLPFGLIIGLGATLLGRRERRRLEAEAEAHAVPWPQTINEPATDATVAHYGDQ